MLGDQACADDFYWDGPSGEAANWFVEDNWQGDVIPNDVNADVFIQNGGTAVLNNNQDASTKEVFAGHWDGIAGHLVIDNATLRARSITVLEGGSVRFNNANLLSSQSGLKTSISAKLGQDMSIRFESGSYDLGYIGLRDGSENQTATMTGYSGASTVINAESMDVGRDYSVVTWDHYGELNIGVGISLGTDFDTQSIFNQHAGTVSASTLWIGYKHPNNTKYDSQDTYNLLNGVSTFDQITLASTGTIEIHDAALHIEKKLVGDGTLDFNNKSGSLTFGSNAQIDLREVDLQSTGNLSVSGADNGVLFVNQGFDPETAFASFQSNALVLVEGQPIYIAPGQEITLEGDIYSPMTIDGTIRPTVDGLNLHNVDYVRGEIARATDDLKTLQLLVAGRTTRVENATVSMNTVVGRSSDDSNLFITDSLLKRSALTVYAFDGGDATLTVTNTTNETEPSNEHVGITLESRDGGRAKFEHINSDIRNYRLAMTEGDTEYHMTGGSLTFTPISSGYSTNFYIGQFSGEHLFTQNSGSIDARTAQLIIGNLRDAEGEYVMHGGDLYVGRMFVAANGEGAFLQHDGDVVVDDILVIGRSLGSNGNKAIPADGLYRIEGGSLSVPTIKVSESGKGVFEHVGGTVTTSTLYIGESTQTQGLAEYRLSGGSLEADHVRVAERFSSSGQSSSRGKFIQTGGIADLGLVESRILGPLVLHGGETNIHRGLILDYGTLDFADGDNQLTIEEGAYALFADGTILGGENATLIGAKDSLITFAAGFDTSQIGTFTTQGVVHFSGDDLVIASGEAIGAAGEIVGDLYNQGQLRPGSSPGLLEVVGEFEQGLDGETVFEIGNPGTVGFDQVFVSGNASLDGNLSVLLYDGFVPPNQYSLEILRASSFTGQFDNLVDSRVYLPGGSFEVRFDSGNGYEYAALTDFLPGILGDANQDDAVDQQDLDLVLRNMDTASHTGDIFSGEWTGDGFVDQSDVDLILANWTSNADPILALLLLGDLDGNGVLDNLDIQPFVQALINRPGYDENHPTLDADRLGDFDGGGTLDNLDIFGFVSALSGGGPLTDEQVTLFEAAYSTSVPEPTSLAMLGVTTLLVFRRRHKG
ncbi:MAG: PEP-CTERM sorting domain-containing protein [Planctomycetota bacterium]